MADDGSIAGPSAGSTSTGLVAVEILPAGWGTTRLLTLSHATTSYDAYEGLQAFGERRSPKFLGR